MKTLRLQHFLRLKFKAPAITKAEEQVKDLREGQEKLSSTQKRVQVYCECPLHPMK